MAYNDFVPYHNFRHVVDVLQAVFFFLLQLGALPPYPSSAASPPTESSAPSPLPVASLLRPFEALTLLIAAIGHDVGHPGVNNAFLVNLKAPLAQLYNDRSVLESFHCAAFSQILRRYWPASFEAANMRKLLINTILATDMGLHFDYMKRLAQLQDSIQANAGFVSDGGALDEQRTLACSLLIKCADISNVVSESPATVPPCLSIVSLIFRGWCGSMVKIVSSIGWRQARKYDVAAAWAGLLTDEFSRQASMETELGIPSALFAPPVKDSVVELGKSQIGFMNLFALPLFQGVADVLPAMQFSADEILANKKTWEGKLERALTNGEPVMNGVHHTASDEAVSPRSHSVSSLSQPPEHHPPAIVATPPCDAFTSLPTTSSPRDLTAWSARSSLASTAGRALEVRRHLSQGPVESSSRQGPPQRSSGPPAFSATTSTPTSIVAPGQPPLITRRSSNTVPSQLQFGMASTDTRRSSADHSVVAVLVTSPGKGSRPAGTMGAGSQASRHAQRHSSEKGSLPSSNEWQSQTSPTTNVTHSPATEATSFLSETSSERGQGSGINGGACPAGRRLGMYTHHNGMNGSSSGEPLSNLSSSEMTDPRCSGDGSAGGGPGGMAVGIESPSEASSKTIRHRPSRWRLNFWRSRRKTPSSSNGGSNAGSNGGSP